VFPRTYYETFMRYEASDQVFVAMAFTESFRHVYQTVIEPAILSVKVNGKQLQPRIINRGTTGSPDIHEQIFDAIIHKNASGNPAACGGAERGLIKPVADRRPATRLDSRLRYGKMPV